MVRFCSIIVSVLFVFVFLLAVHQWNVDNQARYAIVEDTLVILRIIIGVQFAVGIKIISDAIERQFSVPVEWSFMILAAATVLILPIMGVAAAFMKAFFMG